MKVALIRDKKFFEQIEKDAFRLRDFDPETMQRLIYRSAELHLNHISTSGDPFEFGSARPLDFGHWAAHKLEQLSEYRIRHGEAVAIGIALDVIYSRRIEFLDETSEKRILRLLEILGFELYANELHHVDSENRIIILKGLEEFREHLGGELTITLLRAIGKGVEVHEVDPVQMLQALDELARPTSAKGRAARSSFRLEACFRETHRCYQRSRIKRVVSRQQYAKAQCADCKKERKRPLSPHSRR